LEVVQTIQERPDVSFQRPARLRLPHQIHQCLEWEFLHQFAHVHLVVVVDQWLQNLEVCAVVHQFRFHLYYFLHLIAFLSFLYLVLCNVLLDQSLDFIHVHDVDNDVLETVVLHYFQDLHLVEFEWFAVAVNQKPEKVE
jgi:hypothetical protein